MVNFMKLLNFLREEKKSQEKIKEETKTDDEVARYLLEIANNAINNNSFIKGKVKAEKILNEDVVTIYFSPKKILKSFFALVEVSKNSIRIYKDFSRSVNKYNYASFNFDNKGDAAEHITLYLMNLKEIPKDENALIRQQNANDLKKFIDEAIKSGYKSKKIFYSVSDNDFTSSIIYVYKKSQKKDPFITIRVYDNDIMFYCSELEEGMAGFKVEKISAAKEKVLNLIGLSAKN